MAFPESILDDGEEVVRNLRPHWRRIALPVAAAAGRRRPGVVRLVRAARQTRRRTCCGYIILALAVAHPAAGGRCGRSCAG